LYALGTACLSGQRVVQEQGLFPSLSLFPIAPAKMVVSNIDQQAKQAKQKKISKSKQKYLILLI
jgi:hypothetical protein